MHSTPLPPIPAHSVLIFLVEIGVLLALGLLFGSLARKLNMPPVAGELCAGVLVGPSLLGHTLPHLYSWLFPHNAGQMHLVDAIGQTGVILLVGLAGISIDLPMLRRKAGTATTVGAGALLLPLACGGGVGLLLPKALMGSSSRSTFAAFIAVAMCVSAIPVIAKTLLEMRLLHRDVGQLIIGAATVDDVVGWLLLSIVATLATAGVSPHHLLISIGWVAAMVLFCCTLARPITDLFLRRAARSAEAGPTPGVVVLLLLGFAMAGQAIGMEAVIGALFGGMVIGSSKWLDQKRLAPLRTIVVDVLAPIYFATAGLRMDLTTLGRPIVLGAGLLFLAVALASKFSGAYLSARVVRQDHWTAVALGAGLNARGVMEIVLAITGLSLGVLNTAMYTVIVLVAIITSIMAAPVLRFAVRRTADVTQQERLREMQMSGQDVPPELAGQDTGTSAPG
jgi:Kef-type K+ transport system membrane component KefB